MSESEQGPIRPTGDITRYASDATQRIAEELGSRMSRGLSERESVAITTAILKGVVAGVRIGAAEVSAQAIEHGVKIHLNLDEVGLGGLDPWLERYGAGA
jgi:hypothetical protein